jgi:hypothetical protein
LIEPANRRPPAKNAAPTPTKTATQIDQRFLS